LLIGGQTGTNPAYLRVDLNCRVGICHEVVEPGRVCWLTGLGASHDNRIAVLVVHERRCPLCPGLRTRVVDQGYTGLRPSREIATHPSISSPIDDHVYLR